MLLSCIKFRASYHLARTPLRFQVASHKATEVMLLVETSDESREEIVHTLVSAGTIEVILLDETSEETVLLHETSDESREETVHMLLCAGPIGVMLLDETSDKSREETAHTLVCAGALVLAMFKL